MWRYWRYSLKEGGSGVATGAAVYGFNEDGTYVMPVVVQFHQKGRTVRINDE